MCSKAVTCLIVLVAVQINCSGTDLKEWIENWLNNDPTLHVHVQYLIRWGSSPSGTSYSYSLSKLALVQVDTPALRLGEWSTVLSTLDFKATYTTTVTSSIDPTPFPATADILGKIQIHLQSFFDTREEFDKTRVYELALKPPQVNDAGLVEALEAHKEWMLNSKTTRSGVKIADPRVNRIAKYDNQDPLDPIYEVQAEYSYGPFSTFYVIYRVKWEIDVKASF